MNDLLYIDITSAAAAAAAPAAAVYLSDFYFIFSLLLTVIDDALNYSSRLAYSTHNMIW